MALPSTGAISLSQVAVELTRSASATTSLGETSVRSLAGVASGAISLSDLYGKAYRTFANPLAGSGSTYSDTDSGTCSVTLAVNSDGTFSITGAVSGTFVSGNWTSPTTAGIGASYYVLFSVTSGTLQSNGASSWVTLSSSRSCQVLSSPTTKASGPLRNATVQVKIATDSAGTNVVSTGTFTLSCQGLLV